MKRMTLYVLFLSLALPCDARIIFVDVNAPGPTHNGSSWANAYNYLQNALSDAIAHNDVNEILVAHGVYRPDCNSTTPNGNGNRVATFQLFNGITLRGGYAGFNASDPNARNVKLYKTILSGDLASNDVDVNNPQDLLAEPTRSENSYHVVTGCKTGESAVLDGFVITGGNANADVNTWENTRGGGIYLRQSGMTLVNCSLLANSATAGGGGAIFSFGGELTLIDITLCGNAAAGWSGGAVFVWGGNTTLTNCTFRKNWAERSGGGINNDTGGTMMLTDCIFTENVSELGGGINNADGSRVTLKDCIFTENIANQGAAISNSGFYNYQTLSDCLFINNHASWCGGGVWNMQDSSPVLIRCEFIQNTAGAHGGAMSNGAFCSPTIINCTFNGNSADWWYGGAISNALNNPTLVNCIFSGNSAGSYAGAMSCWETGATLINCTFASNSSVNGNALGIDTSAPFLSPSSLYISNCIFRDEGDEIWNNDSATTISVRYSNIQGGWPGEGNIDFDPLCIDSDGLDNNFGTADDDLQLKPSSPCINAGDPNYMADGKIRMRNELRNAYSSEYSNINQLTKENIDISTIVVKDDDRISLFTEGEDYVIIQEGNRVRLDINFDAGVMPPNFEVLQDYYIDYVFSVPAELVQIDFDGNPRIVNNIVDMGACESNSIQASPIADAGTDQTVYAWIDSTADVTLDGSNSNNPDGDELTYKWTWTIDANTYEANGVSPTIELPVGQYVISLIVNDGIVDSEPNEVVITVVGPIEANLCVMPKVLNRKSFQPRIMAMMRLPKGITKDQIDTNEPILLYPGEIEADWTWISKDFDNKCRAWSTTIFASFDKDELMNAIDDNGQVELAVVGRLKTGQYFFGTDDIRVISPGNWPWHHRPWCNYRWVRWCKFRH